MQNPQALCAARTRVNHGTIKLRVVVVMVLAKMRRKGDFFTTQNKVQVFSSCLVQIVVSAMLSPGEHAKKALFADFYSFK